jgi:predicted membrane-bound spermidine synthase
VSTPLPSDSTEPTGPPRVRLALILAIAATSGAGTMTVELAAVRLLTPWFGSSLVVWTNVIAVVLLALSLGYLIGGRLSSGPSPLRRIGWALCAASALVALLPALAGPVDAFFVPGRLTLDEAADVVLWGSLAASLLLFLPPATILGMVAPLAVEAVQRAGGGHAGGAGGRVLGSGTVGSLAGVFATSHLLLPGLGVSGTFLLAGGVLASAGVAALILGRASTSPSLARRSELGALLIVAAGLGGGAVIDGQVPALAEGVKLLDSCESRYQSVRITEHHRFTPPMRFLEVNEGFDSYQSAWQEAPGLLPSGFYYNDFALPAWWSQAEGPWQVLVLGLGGGTAFRVLEGASPPGVELHCTGVELDPEVVRLAQEYLDLPRDDPHRTILADLDARLALRTLDTPQDLVILDCYANQVEIPPHLCTTEFFRETREKLARGGWLMANLGGFSFDDPVVDAVARTCAHAFGEAVLLLRVPGARNFILVARRDGALPLDEEGRLLAVPEPVRALVARRALPGSVRVVEAAGPEAPLTDAHCPIERLQLRSIREGRARMLELR